MSVETEERIEKGELVRLSGITLSDLHNWVKRGLLPAYCGRYIQAGGGSVYFYPAWAVDRARTIKCLRSQGMSMPKVRKVLAEVVIKV
ncbi:hypothetical protein ES703_53982 [subsurface metagenome]